jgi:hypothetical protein
MLAVTSHNTALLEHDNAFRILITMERIFSPCTRLHDILESQGRLHEVIDHDPDPLQELYLDVSTEELLSAERALTFADLYATLGRAGVAFGSVLWLTPHAAVVREHGRAIRYWNQLDESCFFCFHVDGNEDIVVFARSPEHLLEICDIIIRLVAVSVVHSVRLYNWRSDDILINPPTLAYLMEQCQSLKILSLVELDMDEDHIRVLGTYSRPDIEIELHSCEITSAGARALAEVLGRNQGPTKLDSCRIDNVVLANGLRGNSRLKSLRPRFSDNGNREVLAIAGALKENKGLVGLDLMHPFSMSDETWGAICDSLKAHPTLEVLDLRTTAGMAATYSAVIKARIQALVDMMNVNTTMHTIYLNSLDACYSHHALFQLSVISYLETNRFRPRVRAIQRSRPIVYRAKVLGRALLASRTDANSLWMLLSENAEVAVPSTTAAIAAAAKLPTPTTTTTIAAAAAMHSCSYCCYHFYRCCFQCCCAC